MRNFKLTEEQFVLLTANTLSLRSHFIKEMENDEFTEVVEYYQKEIDKINALFDDLNSTLKTNF